MAGSGKYDRHVPYFVKAKGSGIGVRSFSVENVSSPGVQDSAEQKESKTIHSQDWYEPIGHARSQPTQRHVGSHGQPFGNFVEPECSGHHAEYGNGPDGGTKDPSNNTVMVEDQTERGKCTGN